VTGKALYSIWGPSARGALKLSQWNYQIWPLPLHPRSSIISSMKSLDHYICVIISIDKVESESTQSSCTVQIPSFSLKIELECDAIISGNGLEVSEERRLPISFYFHCTKALTCFHNPGHEQIWTKKDHQAIWIWGLCMPCTIQNVFCNTLSVSLTNFKGLIVWRNAGTAGCNICKCIFKACEDYCNLYRWVDQHISCQKPVSHGIMQAQYLGRSLKFIGADKAIKSIAIA
jgi:hypothetical protein